MVGINGCSPANADAIDLSATSVAEAAGLVAKFFANRRNAVYAFACTPAEGCGTKPDYSIFLFDKSVEVHKDGGTPPADALAHAETHPQSGRDNDKLDVKAPVMGEGAIAFAWAKAGAQTAFVPPPSPPNIVVGVTLDLKMRAAFGGDPVEFALSLSDTSPGRFDKTLNQAFARLDITGHNATFLDDLLSAGFTPEVPNHEFIILSGIFDFTSSVPILTVSGNIPISPADFNVTTVDGVATASLSREFLITADYSLPFDLSLEGYAAGVSGVPAPMVGSGLPGVLAACVSLLAWWRRRKRSQTVAPRCS
jgi:hypothetical protein